MSSSTEIRVPRETVNDDLVTIQAWHRAQGEKVREKDVLVSIETSKAVLEVEADREGFLAILHPQGAEVPVGELIGHILAEAPGAGGAHKPGSRLAAVAGTSPGPAGGGANGVANAPETAAISKKAQKLIDEYKLDPAIFAGRGMVRESDVIAFLEQRASKTESAPAAERASEQAAPQVSPEAASPPAPPTGASPPAKPTKGLFGDARRAAGDRGKPLPWVVWNYFWRNYFLGNLARISPRGVINIVHKLRGVKMGRDCFVDPSSTLETAYPEMITMGDDVRVTVGAIIMCHIKAPHYLQDAGIMPPIVKPVVLEDHCFIGVNAVVMPGVTVGKASVVTSGSVVVSSVPPYSMVAGNPAKVIKRFPAPGAS